MPERRGPPEPAPPPPEGWTFLTNHAHVLFVLAQDPAARVRDVAARVGITERVVIRLIGDLVVAGYLTAFREGRRNRYEVHGGLPLRHPVERHVSVGRLVELMLAPGAAPAERKRRRISRRRA